MRGLLPFYPSATMNAAAPDGAPLRRIGDYQKNPFPPCLGEALKRGSIVYITFLWFWCELNGIMSVFKKPFNVCQIINTRYSNHKKVGILSRYFAEPVASGYQR